MIETIAHGDGSRIAQPQRVVVRDQREWVALWTSHAGPAIPAPAVDFASRIVAAVFAGERPSPGFAIRIAGARRDGATLALLVEQRAPPRGLVAAQILVSPFHIVSLPSHPGEVRFVDAQSGEAGIAPPILVTVDIPARKPAPLSSSASPSTSTSSSSSSSSSSTGSSSTGLEPNVAGALAYLAGPFSGALLLIVEQTSQFVRFHAWQALIGLGAVGLLAVACLLMAFVALLISPTAFWALLWAAAICALSWIVVWVACVVQAYKGRRWKLPIAGDYAERRTS